ncbi:WbqC family protein [Ensifer adhaerens]|uniref:WbqC family protein n=1 Tax=Ensifer adhaerens TaxID=106592 RepID=UPI001CBBDF02|nr:WbqC family protein [Ensifer adhaerens]MBZ7922817.1 WbqC family protein [Ensifer adhaerens]UAX91420.1 WbqC family protein [Ensifer adhaerens]UAX99048.1 WbqC family protein [Ensifer adhaerens]UAY06431.1 WbqC family protein [Ensifer adhaerens]
MARNIVISQSMYFPWVGMLEQIKLADVFVHYDDVQFSRGSFTNRVQIKTQSGTRWLTVPLKDLRLGQRIDEVLIDNRTDWRSRHRDILRQAYIKAPFAKDMLELVDGVFAKDASTIADVARNSMLALAAYFNLDRPKFVSSDALTIGGASSERVYDITAHLEGTAYITGHGARNYLDHGLFNQNGISVQYMNYERTPYPQLHGEFTPYVTALDLVANCGTKGAEVVHSGTVDWREFTQ